MVDQSLIVAMNARYEAAWDEYNRLDAECSGCEELSRQFRLEAAKKANQGEVDALRRAMLYQVPMDDMEALVLAKHLHSTFGLTDDFEKEGDVDREAFQVGLDTLLDYMFSEVAGKLPAWANQMRALEDVVYSARRLRTGVLGGVDD